MKEIFLLIFFLCSLNLVHAQWLTLYSNTHHGSAAFASNTSGNHNAAFGNSTSHKRIPGSESTASAAAELFNANATGKAANERLAPYNTTTSMSNANATKSNATGLANVVTGKEATTHNFSGYWSGAGQSPGSWLESSNPSLVKALQDLTALVEEQRKEILSLKIQIDAAHVKNTATSERTSNLHRAVLYQNRRSAFSTETEIDVSLPDNTEYANLVFYTVDGKQLRLLHLFNRGNFTVKVDRLELTRGKCFYALMVEGKIIDSKPLLDTK